MSREILQQAGVTEDERDSMLDAITSDGWAGIAKVMDALLKIQEANVLRYDLEKGPNGLVIEKARAEGAKRLLTAFLEFRKQLRKS